MKILSALLLSSLLLSACSQVDKNDIADEGDDDYYGPEIQEPSQESPTDEDPLVNNGITGTAVIGLFEGTEMGCESGEIGSEVKCNSGSGTIYLETKDGRVYLQDYSCAATQYYVHDNTGKYVEYRPSAECDEDIKIGETYTATGELTLEEAVWRNGKQVDEQWLEVDSITIAI